MTRPDFPRSILEFQARFADEEACRRYLFESRWPEGFSCPRCGGGCAGEQPKRRLWECRDCGHQTSVTAETVMHGTRTSLQVWFWAAYLVATHHPGISAVQLQRQLGIKRYETAWLILHKLRRAMVAPERSRLRGPVEVDEFYVGGIEAGRGAWRKSGSTKAIVVVAVELPGSGLRAAATRGRPGSLERVSLRLRRGGRRSRRDRPHRRLAGYRRLDRLGYDHRPSSQRQAAPGEWLLPRAHRSISNLKAWLHGTHRDVSREHLQVYLDEFVFRHNRRRTPMAAFQTLLGLGANKPPTTYSQMTSHAA